MNSELATLYLQTGDKAKARNYYSAEKDAWPESHVLMNALITNLDRTNKGNQQ